jgi:hypothetical protein
MISNHDKVVIAAATGSERERSSGGGRQFINGEQPTLAYRLAIGWLEPTSVPRKKGRPMLLQTDYQTKSNCNAQELRARKLYALVAYWLAEKAVHFGRLSRQSNEWPLLIRPDLDVLAISKKTSH